MNGRQWAIVIYGALTAAACLLAKETRPAAVGVLKAALAPQLMVVAILGTAWNLCAVYVLSRLGYWTVDLWADTATFVLFGTIALGWRMQGDRRYDPRFFRKAALTNLGIGALLLVFVNTYTFPLSAELVLLPWLGVLGGMLAVSEANADRQPLAKLIRFLISATGLLMLAGGAWGAVADRERFLSVDTLRWALLPFVLTTAYLPYLYALRVFSSYQLACIQLGLGPKKKWMIRWYARLRMIRTCGLNLERLDSISTTVGLRLRHATTRMQVDQAFADS